jgi:predicted AlkP superfamily pyrophosphatase or phosphodiesterase
MATVNRVILVVVDGMRPDAMLQARMPALHRLMETGAYTLSAQTVMPSITLPVHTSMFHSVAPETHGIYGNTWHPMVDETIPGIMDVVRQAGRKPSVYNTWEPLRDLARPGALFQSVYFNIYDTPPDVVDIRISHLAAEGILRDPPDFAFLYLGMPDEIAHRHTWMSQPYLDSLALADQGLSHLLSKLEEAGLLEGTAFLVLSDHGGHEHSHGTDSPDDMTIPWILWGPGVRKGCEIKTPVNVIDTAPTIAHLLGLPIPPGWQGRVIHEALEKEHGE